MLRTTLAGCCPACHEGPLFRGPFALRPACPHCGLPFEGASGEWLGPTVLAYGVGAVAALIAGILLVRRFGFFPGLTVLLVVIASIGALASFRFAKAWWVWLSWRTGLLEGGPGDGRSQP